MKKEKESWLTFDREQFSERIKQRMEAVGIKSNAELAKKANVSAATIGNYINTTRAPRGAEEIFPIAWALDTSIDYLYGLTDDPKPYERDSKKLILENYEDVDRAINTLMDAFSNSRLAAGMDYDEHKLVLQIFDRNLVEFKAKEHAIDRLKDMPDLDQDLVGQLHDSLHKTMRETPLPKKEGEQYGDTL